MKKILSFLLICSIPSIVFGGIGGTSDKRKVVGWLFHAPSYVDSTQQNKWNTAPYNKIVWIKGPYGGSGTGQFIAPQYVLTNTHVANFCGNEGRKPCLIVTSNYDSPDAKVVAYGAKTNDDVEIYNDWSILEVENYCSENYFSASETSYTTSVWQAGFGDLRVLSDKDIKNIRAAYKEWLKVVHPFNIFRGRERDLANGVDLAYNNYDIYGDKGSTQYKTFLNEYKRLSGKDFFADCLDDHFTLKTNESCLIRVSGNFVEHNCNTWAGDSGSSLNASNMIVGLHRGGFRSITSEKEFVNVGPTMQQIFKNPKVKELLKKPCKIKEQEEEEPIILPGERKLGKACVKSDLPSNAVAGHYIKSGQKKQFCDKLTICSCAATECEPGYYLVVNDKGNSQGWCFKKRCPEGKHLNIIDGYKTDTKCVE